MDYLLILSRNEDFKEPLNAGNTFNLESLFYSVKQRENVFTGLQIILRSI